MDFKALYEQALVLMREQQHTITSLHNDLSKCLREQQRLAHAAASLQQALIEKQRHIDDQRLLIAAQQHNLDVQAAQIGQQQALIATQSTLITAQQKQLEQNEKALAGMALLRHQLRMMKKMIYGRRSEKHYASSDITPSAKESTQLSLDMKVEATATCEVMKTTRVPEHTRLTKQVREKAPRSGGDPWPEGLREEVITCDSEDRPEGSVLLRIEERRQLAFRQAEFYVIVQRRYIYMAPAEEPADFRQLAAPLPAQPIEKCKADVSVLVMLIIDKFIFHMPTWRQQQRFAQWGVTLKYNTLCHWIARVCDVLEPLYNLLLRELVMSRYLMMDETTYRVLDQQKDRGKKSHIGYLWACCNPIQRIALFTYQKGRGKKQVAHILQGYSGYLQSDGYGAYTRYGRQAGVIHLQCMAHARRYFVQARGQDLQRADHALEHFFAPLYDIEQRCREEQLCYDDITEKRQGEAVPVLDAFYGWLQQELPKVIAGTPIHTAMTYTLHRFKELRTYTSDGMLEIDNNFTERMMRAIAVGRKNYLFAGSHRGGERAATIYSLLGTCKLQDINPSQWLADVLRRLPTQGEAGLRELLPQFWQPVAARSDASLSAQVAG